MTAERPVPPCGYSWHHCCCECKATPSEAHYAREWVVNLRMYGCFVLLLVLVLGVPFLVGKLLP